MSSYLHAFGLNKKKLGKKPCFLLTSFDLDRCIDVIFYSTTLFFRNAVNLLPASKSLFACCLRIFFYFNLYLCECAHTFVCGYMCIQKQEVDVNIRYFSHLHYDRLARVSHRPWSLLVWFGCSLFPQDQNDGSKQLLSQLLHSPMPPILMSVLELQLRHSCLWGRYTTNKAFSPSSFRYVGCFP